MLETFRRAGSGDDSQDPPHDPFERVGWVGDSVQKSTPWGYSGYEIQHQSGRTVVYFTEGYDEPGESGATQIISEHVYTPTDGGVIVQRTITGYGADGQGVFGGSSSWAKEFLSGEALADAERRRQEKLDGDGADQPNPTDDSDGLGFLDRDPWALFLAWYSGQRGSEPHDPRDDDPGELVERPGHASAAPGVGLEAVINPVDPLWGTSGGGGGGGSLPTLGCPTPVGPPRWM
jgi:hypothetical protein